MVVPAQDAARALIKRMITTLGAALSCDQNAIELAVMTLAANGHLLLEDVPGVGKTTLARALAATMQAQATRIQFTSDLLPSDLTGVTIFNQRSQAFAFHRGPLFSQVVLADEINRANPKTQAALLEAMEERRVSVDGSTHDLPQPFIVIATQNPIELEGTYPLPEAQLDRFMCRISLGYPTGDAETRMLMSPGNADPVERIAPICSTDTITRLHDIVAHVHVDEQVARYVVRILDATRRDGRIRLGASPRAGLALLSMARARALLSGHAAVYPSDVRAMALPVLSHRLIVADTSPGPAARHRQQEVLDEILRGVPAPHRR